jgi:hypothetical protein
MSQLRWAEELKSERALLAKADRDIEEGKQRLRRQVDIAARIRDHGQSPASDRLISLTSQLLIEWEKHRSLIVQRIAYLEGAD